MLDAGFAVLKALRDIYTYVATIKENLNESSRHLDTARDQLQWVTTKTAKLEQFLPNADVSHEEKEQLILVLHGVHKTEDELRPLLDSQQQRLDLLMSVISQLVKYVYGVQNLSSALTMNLDFGVQIIRKAVSLVREHIPDDAVPTIMKTLDKVAGIQQILKAKSDNKTNEIQNETDNTATLGDIEDDLSEALDQLTGGNAEQGDSIRTAIKEALGMESMDVPFIPQQLIQEFVGDDYSDDVSKLCSHIADDQGQVTMYALQAFFEEKISENPILSLFVY